MGLVRIRQIPLPQRQQPPLQRRINVLRVHGRDVGEIKELVAVNMSSSVTVQVNGEAVNGTRQNAAELPHQHQQQLHPVTHVAA